MYEYHSVYRLLNEMFLSDNIPKHEINVPWEHNIPKVSVQNLLKPKTFGKLKGSKYFVKTAIMTIMLV